MNLLHPEIQFITYVYLIIVTAPTSYFWSTRRSLEGVRS